MLKRMFQLEVLRILNMYSTEFKNHELRGRQANPQLSMDVSILVIDRTSRKIKQ